MIPPNPYVVRGGDPPTPDQAAILERLAAGLSYVEIAQELHVGKTTIARRIARLYARLGLSGHQTLIYAGQVGWVRVQP